MATDNTETSTAAVDVVAVLDKDLNQVFPEARPIKAAIMEDSKQMEHPLETGSLVADHRIILPVEITLTCVLVTEEYRQTYRQIKDIFIRGDVLTVQTRSNSYPSMIVQQMPHDEPPEMQDGLMMVVKLKEARFVAAQFTDTKPIAAANPKNGGTVKRGEQKPTETPPAKKKSVAARLADWATN